MAQESYADFSIIQKYLDQKRFHDEEIRSYKAKITEHENTVNTLRNNLEAKEQVISQLNTQLNKCNAQIKEKERGMQELSMQAHRFRKQMEQTEEVQKTPYPKDAQSKKAIFGFLKK
jgi:chromosome segregation ATPase